jgi:TonB family protein
VVRHVFFLVVLALPAFAQDGGIGVLTKPPALVKQVDPVFPPELVDAGVGGDVTLEIDIGPDGAVLDARVAQSAGEAFDAAALSAVKQFVFSPAEVDGVPAAVRIAFTLHFVYRPPTPEEVPAVDAGTPVNFSGRLYKPVAYGVHPETHRIDYDQINKLVKETKPKLLVAGASAYPRTIDFATLGQIARDHGAKLMTDIAHIAGLVAGGVHPSPVPYADFVTTTTHKTLRGPRGGLIMMREAEAKAVNSRVFPGMQGGPLMHVIAAKAIALGEALQPGFKDYAAQVVKNAQAMAEAFLAKGFRLVSGGTDNHLVLLDMRSKSLTGKAAEAALQHADITTNKNMIPGDPESPFVTSGLRIGTPALTSRGMKEDAMREVVRLIDATITAQGDAAQVARIRGEVHALAAQYPLYPGW